jgi:hypothetical protein
MALTKTKICNLALSKIGDTRAQLIDVDTDDTSISRQCLLHYEQTLHELARMHSWNCTKGRIKLCTTEIIDYPTTITVSDGIILNVKQTDGEDDLIDGRPSYENDDETRSLAYNTVSNVWKYRRTDFPGFDEFTNDCDLISPPKTGWSEGSEGADPITLSYDFYYGWDYYAEMPSDCIRPIHLSNTGESQRFLKTQIEWSVEDGKILSNHEDLWLLYLKEPSLTEMDSLFAQAFYTLLATKLAKPIAGDDQLGMSIYNEFLNVVMPEARRVNSFEGMHGPVVDSEWLEATYTSPSNLGSSWPPFSQSSYGSFPWS